MGKLKPDLLSFLDQLIATPFVVNELVLKEEGITAKGVHFQMTRKIDSYGIESRLFRFDHEKIHLFPFFTRTSGLAKICDYIMFVQDRDYLHVLLFELKWGTDPARLQLDAAEVFAEFLLKSAKRVGLLELPVQNIIFRKIRVSEERASQRNRLTKSWKLERDVNGIINHDHSNTIRLRELLDWSDS